MATGTALVITDPVITIASQTVSDQIANTTINFAATDNDVTTGGSAGWMERRPGLLSWTCTFDIIHSYGSNEISTLLWTAVSTRASVAITGKADDASTGASNKIFTGTGYVLSFDVINGAPGDVNRTTVTVSGSGAATFADA